jgi:hypothetical protein
MHDGPLIDGIVDRFTLVDAHGWHIGRCTCFHADRGIWLIHSMDDIFFHMVDVHGCCELWEHFGT